MKKLNDNESNYSTEIKNDFLAIRNWREDERPRERLDKHGAKTLSDAELLAILIGNGTHKFSALDAARELLEKYKTLSRLANANISELMSVRGIGFAKSITLMAAFELSKRIQSEPFILNTIHSSEEIAQYYIPKLRHLKKEIFIALLMNIKNQLIREEQISVGTLTSTLVHPREVFRTAITENAASIILMHNHPSGSPEPSPQDIQVTKNLIEAGKIIDIKVTDHIIIAGEKYSSLLSLGMI